MTRSTASWILGAVVLTGGCGQAPVASPSHVETTPGAASSAASLAPSMTTALPEALVHPWFRWAETTRKWDGAGTWILGMEGAPTVLHGGDGESAARLVDEDTFELVTQVAGAGCDIGDSGMFDFDLSGNGRQMSLEAEADACGARGADLQGDWIVSDCPAFPDDFCLGPLDSGPHVSNFFEPQEASSPNFELDPAAMSYHAPDGWSNTYDAMNEYILEPLNRVGDSGVAMWTDVTIVAGESPCGLRPRAEGRATPEEFAAWLAEQDTLETAEPADITIGDREGLSLDLSVRPGATLPCTGDGIPYAPFLVHVEGSGLQTGFTKNTRYRVYFLDLEDGRTWVIHVAAAGEDRERLLAEGTSIVESIQLR